MSGSGKPWVFGCDSWMFGDGTYNTIGVGQEFVASIEFWPVRRFEVVAPQAFSAEQKSGDRYTVTARVLEVDDFIVIRIGDLDVSCHAPPMSQSADLKAGDFVVGTIGLGLNPFDWDPDSHSRRKRWFDNAIAREREATLVKRRSLKAETGKATSAHDDSGDSFDSYLINCQMVSDR
jgi:hypothetical protein